MKVITFNTDADVNEFLAKDCIRVESLTPVPMGQAGIVWAVVYKQKVQVKVLEVKFGRVDQGSVLWWEESYKGSEREIAEKYEEYLAAEPNQIRKRVIGESTRTEWV